MPAGLQMYSPDGALVMDTTKYSFKYLGEMVVTTGEGTKRVTGIPSSSKLAVFVVPLGRTSPMGTYAVAGIVTGSPDVFGWTYYKYAGYPSIPTLPTKIVYGYY